MLLIKNSLHNNPLMNIQKQCQIFHCAFQAGYFDEVLLLKREVYLKRGLFLKMIHTTIGLTKIVFAVLFQFRIIFSLRLCFD
jgi:hypothetical protein